VYRLTRRALIKLALLIDRVISSHVALRCAKARIERRNWRTDQWASPFVIGWRVRDYAYLLQCITACPWSVRQKLNHVSSVTSSCTRLYREKLCTCRLFESIYAAADDDPRMVSPHPSRGAGGRRNVPVATWPGSTTGEPHCDAVGRRDQGERTACTV